MLGMLRNVVKNSAAGTHSSNDVSHFYLKSIDLKKDRLLLLSIFPLFLVFVHKNTIVHNMA